MWAKEQLSRFLFRKDLSARALKNGLERGRRSGIIEANEAAVAK